MKLVIAAACLTGCTMTYARIDGRDCRPTTALPVLDAIGAGAASAGAIVLATTCDDCARAYVGAGFVAAVAVAETLSAVWGAELAACPTAEDTARAQRLAGPARAAAQAHDCGTALLLVGKIAELDRAVAEQVRYDPAVVTCSRDR